MRNWAILALLFVYPGMISCGKKATDTSLTFDMKPDTSFILPGDHKSVCYSPDTFTGPRLYFPQATVTWNGEGDFYPAIIKIKFKSSQLANEFSCSIQSNLQGLFMDENGNVPQTNYFVTGNTYTIRTGCAIECSGINVASGAEDSPFKISGEAKFIGYSLSADGQTQKPYSLRVTIFAQNLQ